MSLRYLSVSILVAFIWLLSVPASLQAATTLTYSSDLSGSAWFDGVAEDNEGGAVDFAGMIIQISNISDTNGTLVSNPIAWCNNSYLGSSSSSFSGLINSFGVPCRGMRIKSSTGAKFQINQFQWYDWLQGTGDSVTVPTNFTVNVVGYRGGSQVAATTFVSNTNGTVCTVNLGADFDYVDDVRITYASTEPFCPTINNIILDTAVPPLAAPTLTVTSVNPSFTENGSAVDLYSSVTAATNDSGQTFSGMTVTVTNVSNGSSETLSIGGTSIPLVTGSGTISGIGSYNVTVSGSTATVTLSGMALDNTAMGNLVDGMAYGNTSDNPGFASRAITIANITDNGASNYSATLSLTSTVGVTPVNDAPTITVPTSIGAVEDTTTAVTGISTADVDSASVTLTLSLATGSLSATSGGGVTVGGSSSALTLTGSPTNITSFISGSGVAYTPAANATSSVTLTSTVSDGALSANGSTTLAITAVNDAPVVTTSGGSSSFTAGDNTPATPVVIDVGVTISDVDNTTLATAVVAITGNFRAGEDVLAFSNNSAVQYSNIVASYNSATGTMTLTSAGAMATVAQWQNALRAVTYTNSAVTPNTATRTISFRVNDGTTTSTTVTRSVTVTAVDQTPLISTSGGSAAFTEGNNVTSTPVVIDSGITVSDLDNATLASATVTITGNFQSSEDKLNFTNASAVLYGNIVASSAPGSAVLTLTSSGGTATVAQWQAALRAVTYTNLSETPTGGSRIITFVVNDGIKSSSATTRQVTVTAVNDVPTDLTLSATAIHQSGGLDAMVGAMATADLDDTVFTYTLVSGAGATNNSLFNISGDILRANDTRTLAVGSYSVRIRTTDSGSATFEKSFTLTVTDDLAPEAPVISTASLITRDTQPTISGTAEANSTVKIYLDGTLVGTVTADASGVWSYTFGTALTAGSHSVKATATDAPGNTSSFSSSINIVIDNVAPVVTSIARTMPGPVTSEGVMEWRVTFSEDVTGVNQSDFVLTQSSGSSASINGMRVGSTPSEYFVYVIPGSDIGTVRLDLKASGTGIADVAGNALASGFALGQSYTQTRGTIPVAWGLNDAGQLGNNSTASSYLPTAVLGSGALTDKQVVAMASGISYTLALCSDGTVAAWGTNDQGQLGNGTTTSSLVPVAVDITGVLSGKTVIAVAAGTQHSLALCSDGTVAAWGRNTQGQLGNGTTTSSLVPVAVDTTGVLSGKTVIALSAGLFHSLALCSDGTVVAWGTGEGVGDGNSFSLSLSPKAVKTDGVLNGKIVVAIAAGNRHSLALCSDGTVAAWGDNDMGQLGDGTTILNAAPIAVDRSGVLSGKTVAQITAGAQFSLALCSDGTLAAWGLNDIGQLGNGTTTDSPVPVAVKNNGALAGKTPVAIAAGGNHALTLCSDGTAAAWGFNVFGQLGDNSTISKSVPVAVNTTNAASALARKSTHLITTGWVAHHSLAITSQTVIKAVGTPAAGSYKAGDTLSLTLNFDAPVTVTGTPYLALEIGSNVRRTSYASGSGTANLVFSYTVQAGETDTDGIAVAMTAIHTNGGSMIDSNGYAVDPRLPSYTLPVIKVDTTAPETTISTTPASLTANRSASFVFSGDDGSGSGIARFEASLDGGVFTSSTSPLTYTGLADGSHTVQIRAIDAAGNIDATPAAYTWTIDATAPSTPSTPTTTVPPLTNDRWPVFSGTAEAGSTVTVYIDGNAVGTTTASGSGKWFYVLASALTNGAHSIRVTATDTVGNVSSVSSTLNLTIDTVAPAVPPTPDLDAASDSGVSSTDDCTNVNKPTFNGTAEPNSTVTIYLDGYAKGTVTADSSGNWTYTFATALPDGTSYFCVSATDAAGNLGGASGALSVIIDTIMPPPVVFTTATGGTNNNRPTLQGTAEPYTSVTLFCSNGTTYTLAADYAGKWTWMPSTALADGVYGFSAYATDEAGNVGPLGLGILLTVDTTAPVLPVVTTTETTTKNPQPTLTGTAEALSVVKIYDGATLLGTVPADSSGKWSYTLGLALTNGAHTIRVTATDTVGNTSSASAGLNITVDTVAPATPSAPNLALSSNSGSPSDNVTNVNTPALQGFAEASSSVALYNGSTQIAVIAANNAGNWSYAFTTALADGTYAFKVTATDAAGNTSSASAVSSVTIDTIAPSTPVISNTSGYTTNTLPTLNGTAEANSTVALFDNSVSLASVAASNTGVWTHTVVTALSQGSHTITATATDLAGNTSAAATLVLSVGSAPAITTQPAALTVNAGAPAAFSVVATGTESLTYTWQRSVDNSAFTTLTTGTAASYALTSTTVAHTGYYRVIVSNNYGTITSSSAYLMVVPNFAAPKPDGYAAATTGGGSSSSVLVFTAADFRTQATSANAGTITVVGQLAIGNVNVGSNKTIQGADANAALVGNLSLNGVSNVIIRGLHLTNPGATVVNGAYTDGGDALTISGSKKIFVTHCTFFDCADHLLKIVAGSDNVTVSWCEFYASSPTLLHRYGMQIGTSTDTVAPHVTLHHNWWATHLDQRLPYVSYGYIHQYNNFISASGNTAGAIVAAQAELFSERNVHTGVASPLAKNETTAKIQSKGNVYTSCTGTVDAGTDIVFTPAYSYEMLPSSDVSMVLAASAGNTAGAGYSDDVTATASISGPTAAVDRFTSFTLTTSVSGVTVSAYQWRLNNVDIAGATSASYSVAASAATSSAAGAYTVALTLSSGDTVVSAPCVVTINEKNSVGKIDTNGGGGALGLEYLLVLAVLVGFRTVRRRSSRR
ncbi:MAG: Ig-like domain-containing protein [Nibricoccus sp.]